MNPRLGRRRALRDKLRDAQKSYPLSRGRDERRDLHAQGIPYDFEIEEKTEPYTKEMTMENKKLLKKPHILIIMDGWGVASESDSNAITLENPQGIKTLCATYPNTLLEASGEAVGLPSGQMGNSEVGHANIGAGRIVYQDFLRINNAICDGSFYENEALNEAAEKGRTVHLLGLLSDGGVHSHINHLYAILEICRRHDARVRVHCFLDGRDVQPGTAVKYLEELNAKLSEIGGDMKIGSVSGRYYAMDRDNRWERLGETYFRLTGQSCPAAFIADIDRALRPDPVSEVKARIEKGETDEFIKPFLCTDDVIEHGDSVIFFNFRPDRARELTSALVCDNLPALPREKAVKPLFVCMTQYDEKMPNVKLAFPPEKIKNNLGEWLSINGKSQLRIAETEKYAHVTFFFNNTRETPFENEERKLIPSPKVATYDLQPEMSIKPVYEFAASALKKHSFDLIVLNFANCDMVGHTGSMKATRAAVANVDKYVKSLCDIAVDEGGVAIVTADHGNADKMKDADGKPFTAHTTAPVPFIVTDRSIKLKPNGKLCDIAPTILEIMGLPKPSEMTGQSLIEKK